ncbi:MAG TPA: hypothetical protein PLG90_13355 [Ignavibacteria bacterium]|nr:hypothetical protein [Ignavibacteria bacterium]
MILILYSLFQIYSFSNTDTVYLNCLNYIYESKAYQDFVDINKKDENSININPNICQKLIDFNRDLFLEKIVERKFPELSNEEKFEIKRTMSKYESSNNICTNNSEKEKINLIGNIDSEFTLLFSKICINSIRARVVIKYSEINIEDEICKFRDIAKSLEFLFELENDTIKHAYILEVDY